MNVSEGDLRTDHTAASWQVNLTFQGPSVTSRTSTAHPVIRFVSATTSASGSP